MKVKIRLFIAGSEQAVYEYVLEFADEKFELLTEEETNAAIETNVRTWAEQKLIIDWEVLGR